MILPIRIIALCTFWIFTDYKDRVKIRLADLIIKVAIKYLGPGYNWGRIS